MKALITGAGGFVGKHLVAHLLAAGDTDIAGALYLPPEHHPDLVATGISLHHIDLADPDATRALLADLRPTHIYHLAAQSFVPESFEDPWGTLSNNIRMQLNLLEATLRLDLDARMLVVGTAEVYGPVAPEDIPLDESQPLRPPSPYSVSKVTQDMLGLQYFISHDLDVVRVRPFNQIGPGQSKRFVAPAFASQIAAIEAGRQEPVVSVGNLDARRDFTDVRDMVRAYHLLMQHGTAGEVYNAGSGVPRSIQELLDTLLHLTDAPIEVRTDPARMRPVEIPVIACDPRRIRAATGWVPAHTFEDTLQDVLADWRGRISR